MAKNQVYRPGQTFPAPVPSGTLSGDPVVIGVLPGVALVDRQSDGTATIDTAGAYEFTVTGAVTWGAQIYAVLSSGAVTSLTTTASGNTAFGVALGAQAATGKLPIKLG